MPPEESSRGIVHQTQLIYISNTNSLLKYIRIHQKLEQSHDDYALPTEEKREQEFKSLKKIGDSFQKIVIVGDDIASYTNEDGIIIMGLFQFLMNTDILK